MERKRAQYGGNCQASHCYHELGRRIHPGDAIFHDVSHGAWHAMCWDRHHTTLPTLKSMASFNGAVERILAEGVDVVCDTGMGDVSDRQYAAATHLVRKLITKAIVPKLGDPEHIKSMVVSDIDSMIDELRPKNNVEHFEWAANALTRAGLDASLMHGSGPGWGTTLMMPLEGNGIAAEVHFSNTWGGDDGYADYYKVYVTLPPADCYDTWAHDVVFHEAAVNPCGIDCHKEEFLGFVLEAMGALRSKIMKDGWPIGQYDAIGAEDVQEATIDLFASDEIARKVILQSLDIISKRTGSERVQREVEVIRSALHQITED